jgi:hypothetical protein
VQSQAVGLRPLMRSGRFLSARLRRTPSRAGRPLEQQTGQPLTEAMPQLSDGPAAKEDPDLSIPGQEPSAPRAWWRRVLAAVGLRPD